MAETRASASASSLTEAPRVVPCSGDEITSLGLECRPFEVEQAPACGDNGPMERSAPGDSRAPEEHAEFETLLLELSSRFVNLAPGEVDREIEEALRRVCGHLDVESAVLWQWSAENPDVIAPTHAYPKPEGARPFDPLNQDAYPWVVGQIRAGRTVAVSGLEDLPDEAAADRDSARLSGIQSSLCLPLSVGHSGPIGALAFNTLRVRRDWSDATVKRLRLIAQVFTNALVRRRIDEALRTSAARLASAADLADLGFYELDYRGGPSYFDARFRDLCGAPAGLNDGRRVLNSGRSACIPTTARRSLEPRRQLHDGTLERMVGLEYRYGHPARGEQWMLHVARVTVRDHAGHPVRTSGRPPRHYRAEEVGRGTAAVAGGGGTVEGPAAGGERLPEGRDAGDAGSARDHGKQRRASGTSSIRRSRWRPPTRRC